MKNRKVVERRDTSEEGRRNLHYPHSCHRIARGLPTLSLESRGRRCRFRFSVSSSSDTHAAAAAPSPISPLLSQAKKYEPEKRDPATHLQLPFSSMLAPSETVVGEPLAFAGYLLGCYRGLLRPVLQRTTAPPSILHGVVRNWHSFANGTHTSQQGKNCISHICSHTFYAHYVIQVGYGTTCRFQCGGKCGREARRGRPYAFLAGSDGWNL